MGQYTLHLPDGTEYGPVDLATLKAWRQEGRIPADALVWKEGTPDWVSPEQALASAGATPKPAASSPAPSKVAAPSRSEPARRAAPAASAPASSAPTSPTPAPTRAASAPASSTSPAEAAQRSPRPVRAPREVEAPAEPGVLPRALLLTIVGGIVVIAVVAAAVAFMLPVLQKRRAMAEIQRYAVADRSLADAELGLSIELSPGWVALRPDNPLIADPNARMRLAQPSIATIALVTVESLPRFTGPLDAYLDRGIAQKRLLMPSLKETGRSDLRFARGQARLVRTSWGEGPQAEAGGFAVFQDGWIYFSLQFSGPAPNADQQMPELQSLAKGIRAPLDRSARVQATLERTVGEVPELSKGALEELVRERLSRGQGTDDLAAAALRVVSQGLYTLTSAETQELGEVYSQVYGPIPENERLHLARYVQQVRQGVPVPAEEAQAARALLRQGIDSLSDQSRARLQALNDKAFRAGLGPP
jgi:hypothetical protein